VFLLFLLTYRSLRKDTQPYGFGPALWAGFARSNSLFLSLSLFPPPYLCLYIFFLSFLWNVCLWVLSVSLFFFLFFKLFLYFSFCFHFFYVFFFSSLSFSPLKNLCQWVLSLSIFLSNFFPLSLYWKVCLSVFFFLFHKKLCLSVCFFLSHSHSFKSFLFW